ncbi:MAG: glycosyltransferase family 9 protein [Bacteroidales bacterium]|nr:glycosyltransferase family 9 protein [Bacteroidales bacterium]
MKKILVIRFSSIGDIVLTTPVLRCLKTQLQDCTIHYVTKSVYKGLLEHNKYIDKVICLENNLNDLVHILKNEHYTDIIDLHNNLRSHLLTFKLGIKSTSFNKLNIKKWLLVNIKVNKMPPVHIVDRYMASVAYLGVCNDYLGLDYFISENILAPVGYIPDKPFIAWIIGGKHNTKLFPVNKIINICKNITFPVVLLGDSNDAVRGSSISEGNPNIINACGKLSLDESVRVIEHSTVVLTNDTGLMHIAAALNKKIISFWGNTVPSFGMFPYLPTSTKENSIIFENLDVKCRPCSKIGFKECPKKHFKCMVDIREHEVLEAINSMMLKS